MNKKYSEAAPGLEQAIKFLTIDAVQQAKSGHPGMPIGMAEVATVLWEDFLVFNPCDPSWANRDRFILSAGHGSMLLYSLLYLTGYSLSLEEIKNFRQLGSKTAGHPEYHPNSGIETTTGPLGQGFANAVGIAIAERILNARFGIFDYRTYVIAGDGCLMEGISHEAASLAGHLQLNKLIVFFDDNKISIDGPTSLTVSDNHKQRFLSYNWEVLEIDGHNPEQIKQAIAQAQLHSKPTLICCNTVIARDIPEHAGKSSGHSGPFKAEHILSYRNSSKWEHQPFVLPENLLNRWRAIPNRNQNAYQKWQETISRHSEAKSFLQGANRELIENSINQLKKDLFELKPNEATRSSSGRVVEALHAFVPQLIGGSADLTGSNLTKAKNMSAIKAGDFSGAYIYYGVREHAMAAIMNGLALSGFKPYGGTFLVFSDYCRPAIRLSALMQLPVIYIMTHDSIGLGEDGPTHQPIEHLGSLRAIPNLRVFRPADAIEALECWQIALDSLTFPSLISLSRQSVTFLGRYTEKNACASGAYLLKSYGEQYDKKIKIFATGSEVELANSVAMALEKHQLFIEVISVPCRELFWQQNKEYQQKIIGSKDNFKVVIEASCDSGWARFLGEDGLFFGVNNFGISAPYAQVYNYFGLEVNNIVAKILNGLQSLSGKMVGA